MAAEHCYYCNAPVRPTAKHCASCGQALLLQGRYRPLHVMGQGGFGVVYAALDTRLSRRCAIKVVGSASHAEQQQVAAEANILSQNASRFPFMPDIYDIWTERAQTYLVMEHIDGPTLDELVETPWSPPDAFAFLRTLLENLAELHAAGIVHRDLKPANIKRTPQGRFVLLDFGIAKQGTATLTAARALSLDYGSPEQIRGHGTDARSDLYSLGATTYHLLTGQPPIAAHVRLAQIALPAPHTLVQDVPPALETTILRLLELEPDDRPPHASAALDLLKTQPSVAKVNGSAPTPSLPSATPEVPSLATQRLSQTTAAARYAPTPVVAPKTAAPVTSTPPAQSVAPATRPPIAALPKQIKIGLTRRYDLRGGGLEVPAIAWSPNGEMLASGGSDRIVRLWRMRDGAALGAFEGHSGTITSLAWSPDGRLVVSGSQDRGVRMWWVAYHAQLCALEEHTSPVLSVAYAPNGEVLVSGDATGSLFVWRAADTRVVQRLTGHSGRITALAYRADGKMLASGGDTTVRLWTSSQHGTIQKAAPIVLKHESMIDPRSSGVTGVAWSPDGRTIASSGYGAEISANVWLWDAVSGNLLATFEGELYGPARLTWSREGDLLASGGGGSDGRVWLWDVRARRRIGTLGVATPGALAFSPDGSMLAIGQAGGIQLWKIER